MRSGGGSGGTGGGGAGGGTAGGSGGGTAGGGDSAGGGYKPDPPPVEKDAHIKAANPSAHVVSDKNAVKANVVKDVNAAANHAQDAVKDVAKGAGMNKGQR